MQTYLPPLLPQQKKYLVQLQQQQQQQPLLLLLAAAAVAAAAAEGAKAVAVAVRVKPTGYLVQLQQLDFNKSKSKLLIDYYLLDIFDRVAITFFEINAC